MVLALPKPWVSDPRGQESHCSALHFHSLRHCICPQPASAGAPVSEWVLICLTGMLPGPVGEVLDLTKAVKPLISHNLRRPGWGIGRSGQKEESYSLTQAKTPEPPGLFPVENLVGREECLAGPSCPTREEAGSSEASGPEQVCSGGRGRQTRSGPSTPALPLWASTTRSSFNRQ